MYVILSISIAMWLKKKRERLDVVCTVYGKTFENIREHGIRQNIRGHGIRQNIREHGIRQNIRGATSRLFYSTSNLL